MFQVVQEFGMHRREAFFGSLAAVLSPILAGCVSQPSVQTDTAANPEPTALIRPILLAQSSVNLGATIGSLVGAGYGIPIYDQFASVAPESVKSDFFGFVQRPSLGNRTVAVSSYLDFRTTNAVTQQVNVQVSVARDVSADRQNVAALRGAVSALSRTLDATLATNDRLLSELLQERENLALVVESIVEERDRASSAASCYRGSQQQILDERFPGAAALNAQIDAAQSELQAFFSSDVEDAIARIRRR